MYNRTLMEFADRQSDFGRVIPPHGVWVSCNCSMSVLYQYWDISAVIVVAVYVTLFTIE